MDDLAFDRRYGGQHDVMYARRGRLVEARAGEVLGGYALGLPLAHEEDAATGWLLDTVAVVPALQGRGVGGRLVGRLAQWLQADGVGHLIGSPLVGVDQPRRERWMRSLGFEDGDHCLIAETQVLAAWADEA